MNRIAIALSVLTLSACAQPAPPPQTATREQAQQVYDELQLREVQQNMTFYNNVLTYGNAAQNCGLRTPEWNSLLKGVYAQEFALELQRVPLDPARQAQALSYASAHIANPFPPPYVCGRIQQDGLLVALDQAVAQHSFEVAAAK